MTANNLSNNPTNDTKEKLILPGYIVQREHGVFVNLPHLFKLGGFEALVDRLFAGGLLFSKLDYGTFLKLLYDADWLAANQSKFAELKIAEKINYFLPQRQALYRDVKVHEDGKYAEYDFEPAIIEEIFEEQVYGEPDENGVKPVVETVNKTRLLPTKLDFDEFVASMWLNGLKFGIDTDAVRQAIARNVSEHVKIAQGLEPTTGRDAEILEVKSDLRCDNSPKIMASGKADLHVRKNRFPQVSKAGRLLKKIARELGKPGRAVTGEVVEPNIPKDVDLPALASTGTLVKQYPDGEYIVSLLDGFLLFDSETNTVSVVEKIESRDGISVKTTGNLMLDVDEFVEHGEVQEGCVVTGKHMTFLSDVFGSVMSLGGNIVIGGNLSSGSAETPDGNITLGQRVSCAVVRARNGEVQADYCDNTTIVGKVIRVGHAVNCELVADEVIADVVEGCIIAAKSIKITSTNERRSKETLVTVMIPDLSVFDKDITALKKKVSETQELARSKMQEIGLLKSDVEFAKYLGLHEKIKSGALKLTAEQAVNWRKLIEKNSRMVSQFVKFSTEASELSHFLKEAEEGLAGIMRTRDESGNGISCVIDTVLGQTTVRSMKSTQGIDAFSSKPGSEIRNVLQKVDSYKARLFSDDTGAFDWKYQKPIDA